MITDNLWFKGKRQDGYYELIKLDKIEFIEQTLNPPDKVIKIRDFTRQTIGTYISYEIVTLKQGYGYPTENDIVKNADEQK